MPDDSVRPSRRISAFGSAVAAVFWLVAPSPVSAAQSVAGLNGAACSFPAIQAALAAAAPGDEVWVAPGTYAESLRIDRPVTVRAAGPDCRTPSSGGVVIDGPIAVDGARTILADLSLTDSVGTAAAVLAVSSAEVVLDHTRVYGGKAAGISMTAGSQLTMGHSTVDTNAGAGISAAASALTLFDSNVSANLGGGIAVAGGTLTVTRSTIAHNMKAGDGGGISATSLSTVTLTDTAITGNAANSQGSKGGGLYVGDSIARLINANFAGNHSGGCRVLQHGAICSGSGGGLFVTGVSSVVIDADPTTCDADRQVAGTCSRFTGNWNVPSFGGAAIHLETGAIVDVAHTVFFDNLSMGGTVVVVDAAATIENSLFADNDSYDVWGRDATLVISSSTFADNPYPLAGDSLAVRNSIIWAEELSLADVHGLLDWSCNDIKEINPRGQGGINADPLFLDPWNRDFRLAAGSPAADRCPAGPADDLAGARRPVGAGYDMGAYERPILTDVTPPTWPAGSALTATRVLGRSVELAWTAAVDDLAVTGYRVYQDGKVLLGLPGSTRTYSVEGLDPSTSYRFTVQALDAVGNRSGGDPELEVTTAREHDPEGVGFFDPVTGQWWLPYSDGSSGSAYFGNPGDLPLEGDWDCDGLDRPALYRRSDGFVYLRNANPHDVAYAEQSFFYGVGGDVPLAGDWDGDGCDTLAVYRNGRVFIANRLGTVPADYSFYFGNPGDRPFAGDFDGDGVDTIGLYRESTGQVYLRNSLTSGYADLEFYYGSPSDRIVAGDWDGDGIDTVGIFRPAKALVYLSNANRTGFADRVLDFEFAESDWLPVAGDFHAWPD